MTMMMVMHGDGDECPKQMATQRKKKMRRRKKGSSSHSSSSDDVGNAIMCEQTGAGAGGS